MGPNALAWRGAGFLRLGGASRREQAHVVRCSPHASAVSGSGRRSLDERASRQGRNRLGMRLKVLLKSGTCN
ncbi:hypothetical protein NDU88_005639 [Pleurodeles waltl]|uniref:Uncharacterized protein n=1 Tax=Pleurodeles waltl TaxID=8319 RepID=A0AAV7RLL7_PLEWA|nr:hypothetical protein NDU88_005639 [Pleurodeles waltl]